MSPAQMSRISTPTPCKSDMCEAPGGRATCLFPLRLSRDNWVTLTSIEHTFCEIFFVPRHAFLECSWVIFVLVIGLPCIRLSYLVQSRMGQFHILLIPPYSRPGFALHGEIKLNVKQSIDFPYISKPSTYLQTRKHDESQTLGSDYLEV